MKPFIHESEGGQKRGIAYGIRGLALVSLLSATFAARGAAVTVSSGTFSASGVQSGDAVTISGSCENDIEGLSLQSLTFAGSASCELTGKDLTLGAGGLVAGSDDADTAAVTNAVRCRITLADAQTWTIRGTGRELHLHGSLDTTAEAHALTRSGTGVWRLYADTFGDGDITLDKDDGTTYAYGPNCAFGSAKSTLTIKGKNINWNDGLRGGAKLHLCGTVVSNGVVKFDGFYFRPNSGWRMCWLVSDAAACPNVVNGKVVLKDGYDESLFVANPKGQTLVFKGGCEQVRALMHTAANFAFDGNPYNNDNVGTLVVTNGAWKIREDIGFSSQTRGPGTFVFGAPGSTVGGTIYWHGADITFTEDWTLGSDDATKTTGLGRFDGRLSGSTRYYQGCPVHFGTTRQRLGGFVRDVTSGASFDGAAGSVFYCRQTNDVTVAAAVSGDLSFVKEGEGRLTFATASDTTGTLGVTEGSLVLTADAAWRNTTNVLVAGTATLSVSNAATFAARPAVSVADGAKLDLAFAGRAKVATLTLGETTYRTGVFGAVGSGAANETAALTGSGRLVVGKQGIALIIR